MKKFTFLALTATLLFSLGNISAQQRPAQNTNQTIERCGINQWFADAERNIPGFREKMEANERLLNETIARIMEERRNNPNRVNVTYTIPVVFHVVLSNQASVTDLMIQNQLNVLNTDFAGTNPDSTNAPLFYPIRGHSNIQFCFAQRTPTNQPTNGINRVTSGTLSNSSSTNDPIKSTAAGGADAWDPTKYFNIWVGNFTSSGLLGYATFPIGTAENPAGPLNQQGIVVLGQSLPGGTAVPFHLGRTAVHEAGHFFWLRHIWGDGGGCNPDFPGSPAGLDDTPTQSNATSGCPSGNVDAGCGSPNPPGRNYQNYMDYTDDACYSMFTNGQNTRAEGALLTFRIGLTTSNGCIPPVLVPDNASISAIVTPSPNFVTCDPTIPLTVTLRNSGSNALTSATVTVKNNGNTVQTFNWTGNLASFASVNLPLNPVALANGLNSIEVCSSLPNGNADGDPSDDCRIVNGTRGGGIPLPLVEGFESTTFPPAGWLRNNPDGGITWQRTTTGVEHSGVGKAYINHFAYGSNGQLDDIVSPNLAIGQADSLWVSFWGAYKGYPGFPFEETQVLVSTNCGGSFQLVYHVRDDTAFAVAPITTTANYFPASLAEWKRKSVDLTSFIPVSGNIQVMFRQVNRFGNNFFLDDINIDKKIFFDNDAGVTAINKPNTRECVSSGAPEVVIKNYGKLNLTSVRVNFQIDGGAVQFVNWTGNLPRNGTAVVALPNTSFGAVGNHTINAFTSLPNNVADQDPANDAFSKAFATYTVLPLSGSVTEGFGSSTFPPANWIVFNPDGDMTWQRNASIGKTAPGAAWFNDYNNATNNRIDDLLMPNYSYSNIDSIFMNFSLSTVTYSYPGATAIPIDTLSILLSKDCGNTFTTIYKKWGEDLQTVNDPNYPRGDEFFPQYNYQWRLDSLNLGKWLGSSESQFQIGFRFHGNFENNIFLDDVNLRTQVLPAKLKTQGYLVLPNPFSTTFGVWHYQTPTNLKYINVYNSSGQLVWSKQFDGNAGRYVQIDLSKNAAGVYSVTLGYDDANRNVVVPVLKR